MCANPSDNLEDRYNSLDIQESIHNAEKIINASQLDYAPRSAERYTDYIKRIKLHQEIAHNTNWRTHVDNGRKVWHTHKLPSGCFMCNDTQMISVLIQVLTILAYKNPEGTF